MYGNIKKGEKVRERVTSWKVRGTGESQSNNNNDDDDTHKKMILQRVNHFSSS